MNHQERYMRHQEEAAEYAEAIEDTNGIPGRLIATYVRQCSSEDSAASRIGAAVDDYVTAFFTPEEVALEEKETQEDFSWLADFFPSDDADEEDPYEIDPKSKETSLYYLAAEIKKWEIECYAEKASRALVEKAMNCVEFLAVVFGHPAEIRINETFYADIDDVIDAWNHAHPEEEKIWKPQRGEI